MGDTAVVQEFSMAEVAVHSSKDSTWLVIKDVNDGGRCASV